MKTDCREYRKMQELLSLKRQREKGVSDPEEHRRILDRIRDLEKELHLD